MALQLDTSCVFLVIPGPGVRAQPGQVDMEGAQQFSLDCVLILLAAVGL